MSGKATTPGGAIRKGVIVAFLIGGMILLHRFAIREDSLDPSGMLAFGFVVLASYTVGQLVGVVKLPRLIGYIIAGFLLGPSLPGLLPETARIPPFDKGILNHEVQAQLSLIDALAVALIALTAGGELKVESLRAGFRQVMGLMTGHSIAVLSTVLLFGMAISGVVPAIQIDALAALSLEAKLAMAFLLATFAVCTSPAVTIAVIGETGASGPFTRLVLSSVVLLDVPVAILFSVAGTIAASVLGTQTTSGSLGNYLLLHVGGSLATGLALGTLMGLYLRFIGAEVLLFLVGVSYVGTFAARALHLSPLLMFVAAGFACANFSKAGDQLIEKIEALSLPVYVVFFTSAGAHIDLSSFLPIAPYAASLAVIRGLSTFGGLRFGARVFGASLDVQRYGFTGFISQAGVALSLAALIGKSYGAPGEALQTLMIGCIIINELVGAILFKTGLALAKEIPSEPQREPLRAERSTTIRGFHGVETWPPEALAPMPYGPPSDTGHAELDAHAARLEAGLETVAERLRLETVDRFVARADAYWKQLRKEALRHHRRIWIAAQGLEAQSSLEGLEESARVALGDLASVWREGVLEHARSIDTPKADAPALAFEAAFEAVDALVDTLPARVSAPYAPGAYASKADDSWLFAARRLALRFARRIQAISGLEPERHVALAGLARYHLCGRVPPQLEVMATTLLSGEHQMARRSADVFERIMKAYRLSDLPTGDRASLTKRLAEIRREVEERFDAARQEIGHIALTAERHMLDALGGAMKTVKEELAVMSTFELPEGARRYSLVFRERNRAIARLIEGFEARTRGAAADFDLLALELELVRLEAQVARAIDDYAGAISKRIRQTTFDELSRTSNAFADTITTIESAISDLSSAPTLARAIREAADPLARSAAEAGRSASELEGQLAGEEVIGPILATLLGATSTLSARYTVPIERRDWADDHYDAPLPTAEIAFRDAVITFIETTMTRDLIAVSRELARRVGQAAAALLEVERIIAFNAELASAELEVFGETEEVPGTARAMVREMLLGPLGRAKARLDQLEGATGPIGDDARQGIQTAVLDRIRELRALVMSGRASELRLRVIRDLAKGRAFLDGAPDLARLREIFRETATRAAIATVGESRIPAIKRALGFPEPPTSLERIHRELRPSQTAERLPVVYRRLFSEQALEAGDLLTGRSAEIALARRVLSGPSDFARTRALAVIGRPGVGKSALVNTVLRSLGHTRVRRIALSAPVSAEEVGAWFEASATAEVTVLEGFEWLSAMRPGGCAPLERFISELLVERRRGAWVLSVVSEIWSFAARRVSLQPAFLEVITLPPATVDDLSAAVLSRHGMSGYELQFDAVDTLLSFGRRTIRRISREAHVREEWFRALHTLSDGILRDALRLWLESVRQVDEDKGVVHLGGIPRPPLPMVASLSDDELLLLAHMMRQGFTNAELWAGAARIDALRARAEIARLTHLGLIQPLKAGGFFRIAPHLETTVHLALSRRGWVS